MPDLLEVENIASNTPVRTVELSGISSTVLFSALDACRRIYDWTYGGEPLTNAQIDRLYEILAIANRELMLTHIGEIKMTAAPELPAGCLWCDGGIYDRVDYPDLYAAIAPAFIISADEFFVPDLRGKFPSGAVVVGDVGQTGGEAAHTLSVGEIPSHSHTIPFTATTLALEPGEVTVTTPVPILTANTGDTGGGGSHNNIPPYLSLGYYIVAV
jgi:microcystin-dependent protein